MSEKYKTLKVKELQELLQKNDLSTTGKKEELIARLIKDDERKALENLEKEFELDGDFDESKTPLSDLAEEDIFALEKLPLKESVLSEDDDDVDFIFNENKTTKSIVSSASTASTSSAAASPVTSINAAKTSDTVIKQIDASKKSTTLSVAATAATSNKQLTAKTTTSSTFKFTPITFDKKPSTADNIKPPATALAAAPVILSKSKAAAAKATPTPTKKLDDRAEKLRLDAERRLERSKRFGVKLDEKDMKEIRAARFGITSTTSKADSVTSTTAMKTSASKSKETVGNNKENGRKKNKASSDPQQDILKKRAERFGLPEKKTEEKEKQGKKASKNTKNNSKKAVVSAVKENALKKVQKGRITKANTPTAATKNKNIKNITVNVTKTNVLSKKQKNVNMLNKEGIILQNKKNIINQRKVNMVNSNPPTTKNGRVITIAPKTTKSEPAGTLKRKRDESNSTTLGNGRTVTINSNTNAIQRKVMIAPVMQNTGRSRNSNNSTTRKRGPGSRQRNSVPPPATNTPQNQHRNKRKR